MRVERVEIENFKGLKKFEWTLGGSSRSLLVGDNGSGKTSVLQAIALALSEAMSGAREESILPWPGLLMARAQATGRTSIRLTVRFSQLERESIQQCFAAWRQVSETVRATGAYEVVHLVYRPGSAKCEEGMLADAQFLGWHARRQAVTMDPGLAATLPQVGRVFWFDQFRAASTLARTVDEHGQPDVSLARSLQSLREELRNWDAFHKAIILKQRQLAPGQRDFMADLEQAYNALFPGTRFPGVEPTGPSGPFYFLLERNGALYDLAEASAGEQAILPLLVEVVRSQMTDSVVLLDEVEMHLHPPLAQGLYSMLPRLGKNNQFIVTTHSEAITDVAPPEELHRIEGGRLCL